MTDRKPEEQPETREGAKFKPLHPEDATTQHAVNRIRGQQDLQSFERGPTNHSSNPSG
ncbi:MAG: hypothetical protein ACM3XM_21295 [Mycobacterium leprae]